MSEISFFQVLGFSLQHPWFKGRSSRLHVRPLHRFNPPYKFWLYCTQNTEEKGIKKGRINRKNPYGFLYLSDTTVLSLFTISSNGIVLRKHHLLVKTEKRAQMTQRKGKE